MLELALQSAPVDQLPEQAPTLLGTARDLALPLAAVLSAYKIGRPLAVGHVLPDDTSDIDLANTTTERDTKALAVMAAAYIAGVALTAVAVWMLASLAWALAWAGAFALLAAVVALQAARDDSPIDLVRLVAEGRRQGDP